MGDNGHREIDSEKKSKLAVFIVDSQALYRQAIRQVVPDDMEVVGESELTDEIWSTIESLSPDIVLVDAGLPSLSGFGVARQIAMSCPGIGVVILSSSVDDEQLFQALKSGAAAFVGKDISADNLVQLLRKVGQGTYPINETLLSQPGAANKILQLFRNLAMLGKDVERLIIPLSLREGEILRHIAEGNSNKRIAHALGIGEQTIKNHVCSIMRKLNANDRTHAVVLAMRKGWLNIEKTLDSLEPERDLVALK